MEQLELANDEETKQRQIKVFSIKAYKDKFEIKNYDLHLKKSALVHGDKMDSSKEFEEIKEYVSYNNMISISESAFTRELGLEPSITTTDIFVFEFSNDDLLNEKLITQGFFFDDESYIFYSATAGQTRKRKGVFIKETLFIEHEKNLMCGLTTEQINNLGGININKFIAYKALMMSNSKEWYLHDFNINRTILVDDYETDVTGYVDYIETDVSENNYFKPVRQEKTIRINHTDGMGLISNRITDKAVQIRLPWIKGLLVPVDFDLFAQETGKDNINGTPIKDIDLIFTKSQYKMNSYMEWTTYQKKFNEHSCTACICNESEDEIKDKNVSYQMLQTLSDITDDEIENLTKKTNEYLTALGSDFEFKKEAISKGNQTISELIDESPELVNDKSIKDIIKKYRADKANEAKTGKLQIDGKYSYLVCDIVPFMHFLLGVDPKRVLNDREVSFNLYDDKAELVLERSPHCFKEHGIVTNILNEETEKYFVSNCIYCSTDTLLSKTLMYDSDGDKALAIRQNDFVEIAKRNMKYELEDADEKKIVPLFYNMATAPKEQITAKSILLALTNGWNSKGIEKYSNLFTKAWNSENIDDTMIELIKILTMLNNFEIDKAKTNYVPQIPPKIKEEIKKLKSNVAPYFFKYKKSDYDVKPNTNEKQVSCVDKIDNYIKVTDIESQNEHFTGEILASKKFKNIEIKGTKAEEVTKKYQEINANNYSQFFNKDKTNTNIVYQKIKKELTLGEFTNKEVCDILVKSLFLNYRETSKKLLLMLYHEQMLSNVRRNKKNQKEKLTKKCMICNTEFIASRNTDKYCSPECSKEANRIKAKEKKKKV